MSQLAAAEREQRNAIMYIGHLLRDVLYLLDVEHQVDRRLWSSLFGAGVVGAPPERVDVVNALVVLGMEDIEPDGSAVLDAIDPDGAADAVPQ